MGRKQSGGRNAIYLCVAVLIFLCPLACNLTKAGTRMVDTSGEEARAHLALGQKFLAERNYGSALKENEKVISLAGKNTPVDESLFYIGLIHAHSENPARDYGKSMLSFRKLLKDYPESPLAEQAKIIVGLIQENEEHNRRVDRLNNIIVGLHQENENYNRMVHRLNNVIMGLNQENEKLGSAVDRLNNTIDELQKVDIEVEQKKREKGR